MTPARLGAVFATLIASLLGLCVSGGARAQSAADLIPPEQQPAGFEARVARELTRLALLDLRMRPDGTPADYAVAGRIMALAQEHDPDHAGLIRRRLEAAHESGDEATLIALSRDLLRLDPGDTVALLRLISHTINQNQSAEARLEAYARYLDSEAAQRIDPSVRSSLALDAALVHEELGQTEGYVARLEQAATLDSSNKQAAYLVYVYYTENSDHPVGRLQLLINLLLTDPADPNLHMWTSYLLADHGAFREAIAYHDVARVLMNELGSGDPDRMDRERMAYRWHELGAETVMKELNDRLSAMRYQTSLIFQNAEENDLVLPDIPTPEETRLSASLERVRMLASDAAGDEETSEDSLFDLDATLTSILKSFTDPDERPRGMTPERARRQAFMLMDDMFNMMAVTGSSPERIQAGIAAMVQLGIDQPQSIAVLQAWVQLLSGNAEGAANAFAAVQPLTGFARAGLALSYLQLGQEDAALEQFRGLARAMPVDILGAWARSRAMAISGEPERLTEFFPVMAQVGLQTPRWVADAGLDPTEVVSLKAEIGPSRRGPLEPAPVRLRLRNMTPVPMALGASSTLNSKVMLAPRLSLRERTLTEHGQAELMSMKHRLRLEPRAAVDTYYDPEIGFTGWVSDALASVTRRTNYRVIQGYRTGRRGTMVPGLMCLSTTTNVFIRPALDECSLPTEELARLVHDAEGVALHRALGAVRALAVGGRAQQPVPDAEIRQLAEACAAAYGTWDETERRFALAVLPHAGQRGEMAAFDDAARQETDPGVLPVVLVTRVTSPDDDALARAEQSEDGSLSAFASLIRIRAEGDGRCYARAGEGLSALAADEGVALELDLLGLGQGSP